MYNTVSELAIVVKQIIDAHWRLEKSREALIQELREIFEDPKYCGIALRGTAFSPTFEQRLGKKRTRFLKEILNKIDSQKFRFR